MKAFYTLVFLALPIFSQSQVDSVKSHKINIWNSSSIQVMYQNGYVFATNNFLRGTNIEAEKINNFQASSIKFSTQTRGNKLWEQLYKYPNWGVGIYFADFYNAKEVGYPIAIYGFFNAPFKRMDRLSFNYELGFGATFNWRSYNPVSNKFNSSMGAGESFLIDVGLNLQYYLTPKIELVTGFSLTHFSNGTIKEPNQGINTIAPKVSLKYNFYDTPSFRTQDVSKYIHSNEWLISVFAGVINVVYDSVNINIAEKYEGVYFPVFGLTTVYNKQISHLSKFGIGTTITYNGSVNAQVAIDNNQTVIFDKPLGDKIQLSIYPSYELIINKLSLTLQPAFYLYRKKTKNQSPNFHQRVGIKYHFTDNVFIGITLRDYAFHVADFIEWNIGYRFGR